MAFLSKKIFITSFISILAVIGTGWLFLNLMGRVTVLRQDINGLTYKITEQDAERKAVRDSLIVLESQKAEINRINGFFINKSEPVPLVKELDNLAKRLGNKFTIELDENKSVGTDMFFRMSVTGGEQPVKKYLRLLELLPYKIKVEEMNWQRTGPELSGFQNPTAPVSSEKRADTLILLISVKSL